MLLIIRYIFLLLFFHSVSFLQECPPADTILVVPQQDNWDIPYLNTWNELEIITWNIELYPISPNTTNDVEATPKVSNNLFIVKN